MQTQSIKQEGDIPSENLFRNFDLSEYAVYKCSRSYENSSDSSDLSFIDELLKQDVKPKTKSSDGVVISGIQGPLQLKNDMREQVSEEMQMQNESNEQSGDINSQNIFPDSSHTPEFSNYNSLSNDYSSYFRDPSSTQITNEVDGVLHLDVQPIAEESCDEKEKINAPRQKDNQEEVDQNVKSSNCQNQSIKHNFIPFVISQIRKLLQKILKRQKINQLIDPLIQMYIKFVKINLKKTRASLNYYFFTSAEDGQILKHFQQEVKKTRPNFRLLERITEETKLIEKCKCQLRELIWNEQNDVISTAEKRQIVGKQKLKEFAKYFMQILNDLRNNKMRGKAPKKSNKNGQQKI